MWTYYIFPTRIRYEKVDLCFVLKSQGTDSVVCGRLRKYGVHTSNNQMEVPLCTRHPILIWLSMMAHTSTCLPTTQHNTHRGSFNTYNFLGLDSKRTRVSGLLSIHLHWVNLQLPIIIFLDIQALRSTFVTQPKLWRKNGNVVRIRRCQLLWWEPKIKFTWRTNTKH